jgi:hypothetical protein
MGRLIEAQLTPDGPTRLTIMVGDMLQFAASGGHVRSGERCIEMLGPFRSAVVAINDEVLAPMGAPNVVLFIARQPGSAEIDVVTGDPWHSPETREIEIVVQPAGA